VDNTWQQEQELMYIDTQASMFNNQAFVGSSLVGGTKKERL